MHVPCSAVLVSGLALITFPAALFYFLSCLLGAACFACQLVPLSWPAR